MSCHRNLATLPSYLEKNEDMSEIVPLPITAKKMPQQSQDIDMHTILQSIMNVTLTLEEILRCKPKLWTQIHIWLKQEAKKDTKYEDLRMEVEETPREL